MAYPTIVGFAAGYNPAVPPGTASHAITIPAGSTGQLLIAAVSIGNNVTSMTWPAGWTPLADAVYGDSDGAIEVRYRVATGADSLTITTAIGCTGAFHVYRISGYEGVPIGAASVGGLNPSANPPGLTSGFGAVDTLWLAVAGWANGERLITAYPTGYTDGTDDSAAFTSASAAIASARRATATASEDPDPFTIAISGAWNAAVTIALRGSAAPVAAFTWSQPTSLLVVFDDTSTNAPTSWAWDFGDGVTSTNQNPSRLYAAPGTYTVTLTVSNASGGDSVSHSVKVTSGVYVPPIPALALLEIWTNDPGSPRWDEAVWDGALWGASGWQNVTPLGVEARIQWGSTRPELGILSVPDAGSWYVTFHDPDRILDPANRDSPYAGDLKPGLPIRVTHRGIVIRTGISDVIGHSLADRQAVIRGSDNISLMARADVPPDIDLPDTLRARAVAAIAAAGINVRVESVPPTGDVGLAPQPDGPMTVWEVVRDAAQSVLHIPYVDEDDVLRFRPWRVPLDRGRIISSPNLVDIQSIVDTAGLIDTVQVQQVAGDGGLLIERRNTPTPYFGHRVFKRANETPNADDFATTILNDRAVTGIRWVPGDVYAATASEVEYFAQLKAIERVTLRVTETEPDIAAPVVIVGGTVTVRGRTDRSAAWTFGFEAASTNEDVVILTLDGGTDTDYLTTESGSDYLYGDI